MSYFANDSDKDIIQRTVDRVLGPGANTRINRSSPAGVHSRQKRPERVLLGIVQLTAVASGAGATALWDWKYVQLTAASATFTQQATGSASDGPCRIAPGTVGAANTTGLLYYVTDTNDAIALLFVPLEITFKARITAVSGGFPIWAYTVQRITGFNSGNTGYLKWTTNGTDIAGVLNGSEFATQSGYPYTYGNGVTITASDGTVNGGSCKIKPLGIGRTVSLNVTLDQSGGLVYYFEADNSAQ
jgi:hypothetical protein